MSNPLDATPMQLREELAIVWSIFEQEKEFSSRLKKALAEREKQVKLLRDALLTCSVGDFSTGHVIPPSFDEKLVEEALAATEPGSTN